MLRDQVAWAVVGSCLRVQALATGCSSSQYHSRHSDWNLVTAGFPFSDKLHVTYSCNGQLTSKSSQNQFSLGVLFWSSSTCTDMWSEVLPTMDGVFGVSRRMLMFRTAALEMLDTSRAKEKETVPPDEYSRRARWPVTTSSRAISDVAVAALGLRKM